jgi:hypothetical protein
LVLIRGSKFHKPLKDGADSATASVRFELNRIGKRPQRFSFRQRRQQCEDDVAVFANIAVGESASSGSTLIIVLSYSNRILTFWRS